MANTRDIDRLTPEAAMDYENGFYWFAAPNRLAKLCVHYELYKLILGLPGEVIEAGVFKASTLIRLATFRHFFEVPAARSIYAFDAFGFFPKNTASRAEDVSYAATYDANFGEGLSVADTERLLKSKGLCENVHCVAGDITETMPGFFTKNLYMRLAFVHVDVEVYEPTKVIIEHCWPRLVPGGVLALDDFNGSTGAAKAIEEFLHNKPELVVRKLPFTDAPAYVIK
jgi:hypothetical protein